MIPLTKAKRLQLLNLHNQNLPDSKWNEKYLEKYFAADLLHPICLTIGNSREIIGLAAGRLSFNNHSKLNLSTFSVSPRFQGRGHGEKLLRDFFKASLDIPTMKMIYLHFRDSNKKVKAFYTKFGFTNHKICGKYSDHEHKHYMDIDKKSVQKYLSKFK